MALSKRDPIADKLDAAKKAAATSTTPTVRAVPAEPAPAGEDSAPVRRKRKETLIPFATRLPLGLPEEIKAHCEQMDELITDFMARAARDTIRRDRERYL